MNAEEVNQHIQELEKLRGQTRRFRLLTILALIAIVVIGVSAIINSAYSLASAGPKQNEFVNQLSVRAQRDVLPVAEKIAGHSLERLKPAVEAELEKLNARAPQIADAALKELDTMGNELPVQAEKILDQTVGDTLKKREDKLRKMYPGVYDRQLATLLDNLNAEAQDQLAKTGEKIFNPHLNSIQSILSNLEKIQKTEPIDPKQQIDPWQAAFLFFDVFVTEFKDLAAANATHPKETMK
jgi:capsule polysaccharide export protein KpsE/RkpR